MKQGVHRRNAASGFRRPPHKTVMLGPTRAMSCRRKHIAAIARDTSVRRASGGLLLALCVGACAVTPATAPPEAGDARARYAPGMRQTLLAWLDAEWRLFGDGRRGHVVDLRRVGPPESANWSANATPERRLCPRLRAV
ncbi:MAG: hypothetical protein KIT36_23650, partial [Alphaproteobacteria bacterium]|nr:hypothetical protein [Alphaproteobacteria bacterium]